MSTVQRIAKNTSFLFLSHVIGLALSFFYLIYTTRYLGAESYGILSFALAYTSLVGFFTDIGLLSVTIRDVARDRSLTRKYMGNMAVLKLSLAIFTIILTIIIMHLNSYSHDTALVIYIILFSVILNAFAGIFIGLFQAYERMEYVAIGSILNNFVMLIGALYATSNEMGLIEFAYIYLLAGIALLIYNFVISSWKIAWPHLEINLDLCRYLLREAVPFGLSTFFIRIYYYIDTIMISFIISNPNEIMGWYSAAYRLVFVLSFIPTTFLMAIYPIMSKCYVSKDDALKLMFERSFKYLLIIAVPIGVGITSLASKIILFSYGPNYAPSTIALQILVWSEVFIFLNSVFGNLLNAINKQIVVAKQTMFASLLNIMLNLVLITKFSYIGASIATVITNCFSFIFLFIFIYQNGYGFSSKIVVDLSKVLAASSIMYAFIHILNDMNLVILIILSMCVYFFTIYLLKIMDDTDLQLFKKLIRSDSGRDLK